MHGGATTWQQMKHSNHNGHKKHQRVVVHMVTIAMTETKVTTVMRLRASQNIHKLESEFRMPKWK